MTELYDRLGLSPFTTQAEIKAAYRKLVKSVHPDAGGGADEFAKIQQAYDVLSDPERRKRYDETGSLDTMDRENRVDSSARQRFADILIKIVDSDAEFFFTDPLAAARRQIEAEIQQHRIAAAEIADKKVRIGHVSKRFTPKTLRNIPEDIFKHMLRQMDQGIAQAKARNEVLERVIELIDEYEFEVDPPPNFGTNTTYSSVYDPWGK